MDNCMKLERGNIQITNRDDRPIYYDGAEQIIVCGNTLKFNMGDVVKIMMLPLDCYVDIQCDTTRR